MIRNYLLIALRNVFRQKGYSLINISGLAIGIVSCLLIVLYIADEFSYDRFHAKGDRIYRLFLTIRAPMEKPSLMLLVPTAWQMSLKLATLKLKKP